MRRNFLQLSTRLLMLIESMWNRNKLISYSFYLNLFWASIMSKIWLNDENVYLAFTKLRNRLKDLRLNVLSTMYDTRSLSPQKCSANYLRTSSFQCIFISKSTVAPTLLFLHLIRLLKPFSKSILQCKIE